MAIKNIIFDLDNTLIEDKDEDILYYKEALSNLSYDENDYKNIYDALGDYELNLTEDDLFYSKEKAMDFVNKKLNKNYSLSLMDELNKVIAKYWCKHLFIQESTLKYLSSKYNLYVFSNWFKDAQLGRLENIGFSKYFKDIFTPEFYGAKPFKAAYQNVLDTLNCSPAECVMIGDSKFSDIFGSTNIGMNAILFDYDGNRDKKEINAQNYSIITDLKDLETIL